MERFEKRSQGQTSLASRILNVLAGGVTLSTREIAQALGASENQVRSRLSELKRKKFVERHENGWRLSGRKTG